MFELSPLRTRTYWSIPSISRFEWPAEPSIPIRIVLHGLMGEIEVAGTKYNNVMSPQGMLLNDQEITMYKLRSFIWGNKADVEITAEMVKEQRDSIQITHVECI